MDGATPFLPQEIVRNILKRLPVKSLVRFQCVSKEWKNLIKTPSFIADQLHHSSHQIPSLLLQQNYRNDPLRFYLLSREMRIFEVPNPPLMGSLLGAKIIGSSNGLVCVEIDRYGVSSPSLLLWNPSTREVRPLSVAMHGSDGDCALGFGFSPIVNDYKIVRTYAEYENAVKRVEVYSLSTGSWKEIEFRNLEGVRVYSDFINVVTVNGAVFFYGANGIYENAEDIDSLLVSFDIATEVFTVMPWPDLGYNSTAYLTEHDNKLAIVCLTANRRIFQVELWVMEEVTSASGKKSNWTKKYRSKSYPYFLMPVTMWGNEIICSVDVTERDEWEDDKPKAVICLFNVCTNESKFLTIHRGSRFRNIFNYVESLVPVGNIHIEEPRPQS